MHELHHEPKNFTCIQNFSHFQNKYQISRSQGWGAIELTQSSPKFYVTGFEKCNILKVGN